MNVDTSHKSPNFSSRAGQAIDLLLLHATVGPLAPSIAWLCNPASEVSSHYTIAKTGAIYQLVDEAQAAWHAGVAVWQGHTDVNAISIGVELENANDGRDPYPPAQVQSLLQLTRDIQTRHPAIAFARHLDVARPIGRKTDPAGFGWVAYLASVTAAPPRPSTKQYKAKEVMISQRLEGGPPYAGQLAPGEVVTVDKWYSTGKVHLADGRGFVSLSDLESV